MARHKRFADYAGYKLHCWECVHSYDWDGHIGFCDVYGTHVKKYDSPNNGSTIAGGCGHYSDGKEPMSEAAQRVYDRLVAASAGAEDE